jgi:hypothetical protein
MEGLCISIDSSTLHSTKSHESEKGLFTEPVFRALSSEDVNQRLALPPSRACAQGHVQIRLAEVTVPFRNLVFENELLAEGVPGQVGHDSVVLVPVVTHVSEDDVRTEFARETFERVLDGIEMRREVSVTEFMEVDRFFRPGAEEFPSSTLCLARAGSSCAPDHPSEFWSRSSSHQLRQCAAAPDLDVVRVRANTKDPERRSGSRQIQP